MIKVLVNNEEVVCDNKITINEEMLSTSSTILRNCYPKTWEDSKDYVSNFYFPKDYSKCKIIGGQQTRTGKNFSFTSVDDYFDYKLLGTSSGITQNQIIAVTGKNLFNINDTSNVSTSYITTDNEGWITATVNNTSGSTIFANYMTSTTNLLKTNTTYRVVCEIKQKSGTFRDLTLTSNATVSQANTTNTILYADVPSSGTLVKTFTTKSDFTNCTTMLRGYVAFSSGESGSVTFRLSVVEDPYVTPANFTYEPFGNEYQINLGKNLFDNNGTMYQSTTATVETIDTGIRATILQTGTNRNAKVLIPNSDDLLGKKVTLSANFSPSASNTGRISIYQINSTGGTVASVGNLGSSGSATITMPNSYSTNAVAFALLFYANTSGTSAVNDYVDYTNVQLELGTKATSYSNYFTPIVLNEGDYIYKDETWKTYINGTSTDITRDELITELNAVQLRQGLNNISSTAPLELITSQLIFCGCVKNTGNISLNPREPHYVDLQVLDFKTLLSEGETLNYVITDKTIPEAIAQVVSSISDYGFVVGNIQILNPNDKINAYSTLNKTAYDVFQYIADVTQSKWFTRVIDEDTIAIDFYDPTLMPQADDIEYTQQYFEDNDIEDMTFNYSTNDYRNKQIMTSDEVYANITQTETIIANGYQDSYMCQNKIGQITSITVNGTAKTFITKSEEELGLTADFIYQPGEMTFTANSTYTAGAVIVITYYAIVKGREIILNSTESNRIESQINRKGTISRYENRNDTTSSQELIKIGQSYIKYKGSAEITLKITTSKNLFNVGQIVEFNSPLEELSTEYLVKGKEIEMIPNIDEIFYTFELSSNFNSENAINYFDNQRAKNQGNIGEGETITRNIDLESTALIEFYDFEQEEVVVINPTSLDFALDGVLI